jgi:hypothetical protein
MSHQKIHSSPAQLRLDPITAMTPHGNKVALIDAKSKAWTDKDGQDQAATLPPADHFINSDDPFALPFAPCSPFRKHQSIAVCRPDQRTPVQYGL